MIRLRPASAPHSGRTGSSNRYELGNDSGITHLSTTNFVINKKFHSGLSAYVGVDNIFDERNVNLFNDGRVWRGGLKYTF